MLNERPTLPTPQQNFRGMTIAGLVLLAVGLIMVRRFYFGMLPKQFSFIFFLSPMIVTLGAAMLLLGFFRFWRGTGLVSAQLGKRRQKFCRILLWSVALLSVFPWWWLGIFTRLEGGRPGNEGEGMLGFMMMIFIGLPMLALAIGNEIRIRWNRYKEKRGRDSSSFPD